MKNFKLKWLLLSIVLSIASINTAWAWDTYFCLGGTPVGTWSKNTDYEITVGDDGCGYYEAYIETNETFCFYQTKSASQYGPTTDQTGLGIGGSTGKGEYNSNAWKFTGTNQKVRFCINQKANSDQYYPSVTLQKAWDPKDDIQAVLAGTKVMFYFGDNWGTGYKRLYTGSGKSGEAWAWLSVRDVDGIATSDGNKDDFRWAVACLAPARYYVSNGGFDGIQMTSNAEAGKAYILWSPSYGVNNLAVGDNCSYATINKTSATIEYGTANSGLSVSSYPSSSIIGKSNSVYGWYKSSDGGSTWSEFDPAAASTVAPGTYKVAPLITDGTIYVKGQEATLTVTETKYTVTVTAGANGSITTPAAPATTVTAGGYTSAAIVATPIPGYRFSNWTTSDDIEFDDENSASTTITATGNGTVTANFVRHYAYIEGRFRIYNEARDGWAYTAMDNGNWGDNQTNIPMSYDATSHLFYLRTYTTPKEYQTTLSGFEQWFFIKTSSTEGSLTNAYTYQHNPNTGITSAETKVSLAQGGDFGSVRIDDADDESGYVVIYFDESYVWYEVEPVTFKVDAASTSWSTATNWSPNVVPTSDLDVMIESPVTVNIDNARAKSVKIYNDGDTKTGKLTIGAGSALIVEEDIKKTTDGSTKIATTADVLHIEAGTSSVANGALVWGTEGTPGKAQVDFYTKSHGIKGANTSINQYIGTPFSDKQQIHYQYYYSWMYKIARNGDGDLYWDLMETSEGMNPYEGYNFITAYDEGTTYQLDGTLVSNADMTLTTSTTPALVYSGSGTGASPKNENVLANSWVAPIHINSMDAANNFSNVEGSIYIFNAGSPVDGNGNFTSGTAGNYTAYSIGTAASTDVIPSMQSFSVFTRTASPSIKFNYNAWVKTPMSTTYNNSANKAPRRSKAEEMKLLKVRVQGENGWADELKIYTHEEFSMDFEDSWDAHKMYGYPETPQLYAISTDGALAISCVPTADNNVLGFTPGSEDSEYTFSFDYNGDEDLYLRDTKLNVETPINNESSYYFVSESNDSDMRFVIIKKAPAVATGIDEIGDNVSGVQKIMHNGTMYIVRDGRIYNAEGSLVK